MIWLILWMACDQPQPTSWEEREGLEPILERMDVDQSGGVEATEFKTHSWKSPEFSQVDADSDQQISRLELRSLLFSQDVQSFDGRSERRAVDKEVWARPFAQPRDIRLLWELLSFLDQELAAGAPDTPRPTFSERDTAARTGKLDSAEVLLILEQYRQAYRVADLNWPRGLLESGEDQ